MASTNKSRWANDDDGVDKSLVAIKVEKPGSVWEAVVLERLRRQLQTDRPFANIDLSSSIVETKDLYAFADESYLLLEYAPQGTLLELVNKSRTKPFS